MNHMAKSLRTYRTDRPFQGLLWSEALKTYSIELFKVNDNEKIRLL